MIWVALAGDLLAPIWAIPTSPPARTSRSSRRFVAPRSYSRVVRRLISCLGRAHPRGIGPQGRLPAHLQAQVRLRVQVRRLVRTAHMRLRELLTRTRLATVFLAGGLVVLAVAIGVIVLVRPFSRMGSAALLVLGGSAIAILFALRAAHQHSLEGQWTGQGLVVILEAVVLAAIAVLQGILVGAPDVFSGSSHEAVRWVTRALYVVFLVLLVRDRFAESYSAVRWFCGTSVASVHHCGLPWIFMFRLGLE